MYYLLSSRIEIETYIVLVPDLQMQIHRNTFSLFIFKVFCAYSQMTCSWRETSEY